MQFKNENGDISLLIDTRANPSSGAIFHLLMKNVNFSTREDSFMVDDGFTRADVKAIKHREVATKEGKRLFIPPSVLVVKTSRGLTTMHHLQDPRVVMNFPLVLSALKKREREQMAFFEEDYSQDQY
jgi:hypothetical protein